jgi:hypothetical protein
VPEIVFLFIFREACLPSSDVVLKKLARESGEKKGAVTPVDVAPLLHPDRVRCGVSHVNIL